MEYKEDFPQDLAKYIAGFANHVGGILLIGIRADKTKNIPTRIPGIILTKGLVEKVIAISQKNIQPPIRPDVCICPFKSRSSLSSPDRAVVLIRVKESYETPHKDLKHENHRIYVRRHNKTIPADNETIKTLSERAERGRKNRDNVIHEYVVNTRQDGFRSFFAVPSTPMKPIISFNRAVEKILIDAQPTKYLRFGDLEEIQDGVQFRHQNCNRVHITKEGLIGYREPWRNVDFKEKNRISLEVMILHFLAFLKYIKNIYEYIGYSGSTCIGLEITGVEDVFIHPPLKKYAQKKRYGCQENIIHILQCYSYDEMKNMQRVVKEIYRSVTRCFGFLLDEKIMDSLIEEEL